MPPLYCRACGQRTASIMALLILTATEALSQPAAPHWTNHTTGSAHSAEISAGGRTLSVMCNRGGKVLLGLTGFGGRAGAVTLTIDGRAYRNPAVTRNGVHFAQAAPNVLHALVGGGRLQASAGGSSTGFSLAGSGAAINAALSACGLALR